MEWSRSVVFQRKQPLIRRSHLRNSLLTQMCDLKLRAKRRTCFSKIYILNTPSVYLWQRFLWTPLSYIFQHRLCTILYFTILRHKLFYNYTPLFHLLRHQLLYTPLFYLFTTLIVVHIFLSLNYFILFLSVYSFILFFL